MPEELKDLRGAKEIAIDLETNDPHLKELGSGNVTGKGHIAGVAVAVEGWISTGHFSVPFIPEYEGMNSFPGRIMHSHDFRDAEEFRDKNVIILGSSYSAEDVALLPNSSSFATRDASL